MMSSEEDVTVDSFGLLKKTKRSRQRVDAGEPRNSYSSIPNFSSRPNLLNSGIYGAFFAAQSHHNFASSGSAGAAAYFNQGFGPTKMLNELLSRRVKTIADGSDAMMTIDVAGNDVSTISGSAYDCLNSQSPVSRVTGTLNGGGGSPPVGEMAQHMLRNILSGKRKEIYALEQELRGVSGNNNNNNNNSNNNNLVSGAETVVDCNNENSANAAAAAAAAAAVVAALNNNNSSCNNNNNNNNNNNATSNNNVNNNNDVKIINLTNGVAGGVGVVGGVSDENCVGDLRSSNRNTPIKDENTNLILTNGDVDDMDIADGDDTTSAANLEVSPSGQNNANDSVDKLGHHRHRVDNDESSASERSVSSPESVSNKEDADESKECSYPKSEQQVELKRARVENIVSSMRSSPLPGPVNGCKKRKLYHPQQHDNSVAERYAASLNDVADALSEDEDENLSPAEIREKVVEKNALKNQLRTMQEQLAEMQQKYVQLCTRMDQDSVEAMEQDTAEPDAKAELEQDETASDADREGDGDGDDDEDDDDDNSSIPPSPSKPNTPVVTATSKDHPSSGVAFPTVSTPVTQSTMSPAISKMLGSKFLPQNPAANVPHMNSHPFPIHPNFNGALSFLQHQMFQDQQHAQNHLQQHHHPHHHHPPHPHSVLSNAAAMYLGVGHKLFMEQEARMAEKAALAAAAAEHQQQQMNNRDAQHGQQGLSQRGGGAETAQLNSQSGSRMESSSPQSRSQLQQQQQQNEQSPKSHHPHHQSETSSQPRSRSEFADRLQMLKSSSNRDNFDFEGLAEALKSEISSTLSNLIDTIMTRFLQQKKLSSKSSEAALAAEQLNKDLLMASQLIDRKSPRTKVIDRGNCISSADKNNSYSSNSFTSGGGGTPTKHSNSNAAAAAAAAAASQAAQNFANSNPENNINVMNLPQRPPGLNSNLFGAPKMGSSMNSAAAAAALYSSMNSLSNSHMGPFCLPDMRAASGDGPVPEQHEALSLVVPQKKKRHKVTDTRITPRTVSRILAQDGMGCPPANLLDSPSKYGGMLPSTNGSAESPPPRSFHIPPSAPMLPVSLPTSVAIPNPGLHESQVYSPYSPFYGQHPGPHHIPSSSPPGMADHLRDSPPLPHHSSLFHPAALLAAAQQQQQQHMQRGNSPDYVRSNSGLGGGDSLDRGSDCNSMDGANYDGMTPTSSTLSPMHLRKAKLMFFWVRYPSSAVLKMYFPDIKFNKNNTAQLVKWFSNFREFYYIQMEKYARQAISEGIKNADDLHVSIDCDIYRVLNLHYNRNNHIEVPANFRYVVEQTLREFFKAIQTGKDQEQSWKKSIYKVISRLDDPVPENFKTPHFLEQLE